jgi:hypothetical protein
MIRPDQIPPEAVKAAWQAMMAPDALAMHRAIAAAINAWPGSGIDAKYWLIMPIRNEEGEA